MAFNPIFALPNLKREGNGLTHGVMVTQLILVQFFKVRILMGQLARANRFFY